jgi:hypothetical protein
MQIVTTIPHNEWHWSQAWLETVLDKTDTAQVIVYNQMPDLPDFTHPRLAFWDMHEHVMGYTELTKEINHRLERALSDGAKERIFRIWRCYVRDICIADFMQRSPYEMAWWQATAWPQYSLHQDWLRHNLEGNDCVLWNHQGHQRTDVMLLGGSPALRQITANHILSHYHTGTQWISHNPNLPWSSWLTQWQRRVIEGDDEIEFY